jgi:hypothetical protein
MTALIRYDAARAALAAAVKADEVMTEASEGFEDHGARAVVIESGRGPDTRDGDDPEQDDAGDGNGAHDVVSDHAPATLLQERTMAPHRIIRTIISDSHDQQFLVIEACSIRN